MPKIKVYLSKVTDCFYVDGHIDSTPDEAEKLMWYALKDTVDMYSVFALFQRSLSPVEINVGAYSYHSDYDEPLYGPIASDVNLEFPFWAIPSYAAKVEQIKEQGKIFGYEAKQGDILIDRDGVAFEVLKVTAKTITWRPMFYHYPRFGERDYNTLREMRKPRRMLKSDKQELFYHTQDRSFVAQGMKITGNKRATKH